MLILIIFLNLDFVCLIKKKSLYNVADIIPLPIQDEDISSIELHKVSYEVEKYRKTKSELINQYQTKLKQITKKQLKELLEKEKKRERKIFYKVWQLFQVSRVLILFTACDNNSIVPHLISCSIKAIKFT